LGEISGAFLQKMAYASYPAPPVATDEVMGGAEEYLDTIADDVPLFTNTREGVYSQVMPQSPNPIRLRTTFTSLL